VVNYDLKSIGGHLEPSIETAMHLGIYKCRSDVRAVIHTHPVFTSVLSNINQPIPALLDEIAFEIGASVEIVPYAISGSSDLAQKKGLTGFCLTTEHTGENNLSHFILDALEAKCPCLSRARHR
jgi:L-fuculose-phosphate aldolase